MQVLLHALQGSGRQMQAAYEQRHRMNAIHVSTFLARCPLPSGLVPQCGASGLSVTAKPDNAASKAPEQIVAWHASTSQAGAYHVKPERVPL